MECGRKEIFEAKCVGIGHTIELANHSTKQQ